MKGERLSYIIPKRGLVVVEEVFGKVNANIPVPTQQDLPKRKKISQAEIKELTEQVD